MKHVYLEDGGFERPVQSLDRIKSASIQREDHALIQHVYNAYHT